MDEVLSFLAKELEKSQEKSYKPMELRTAEDKKYYDALKQEAKCIKKLILTRLRAYGLPDPYYK